MLILGVETSCDDSSAAIVEDGKMILSNIVANQDMYHKKYGGVVPEIAARKHLEHIQGVIKHALSEADITLNDVSAIAVTHRPGLVGSLIVGLTAAKSLAYLSGVPIIGIHHIEAHAYAACFAGLEYGTSHISLVASGGHTSLLDMGIRGSIRLIGQSVDDAAGEAYDKVSKLLGFGYPGGAIIDKLATSCQDSSIQFPRPMMKSNNLDFSFSGLKTAVMYHHKKSPDSSPQEIACSFQEAVVDVLVSKTLKAARLLNKDTVCVGGGVAANSALRRHFKQRCRRQGLNLFIPKPRLCTDNAAMVAGLGYHKMLTGNHDSLDLGVASQSGLKRIQLRT